MIYGGGYGRQTYGGREAGMLARTITAAKNGIILLSRNIERIVMRSRDTKAIVLSTKK